MQIVDYSLNELRLNYPLEKVADLSRILFIDIETTGFQAKTTKLYLIGCAYYAENEWKAIQFFAEDYCDEKELLEEFCKFASRFSVLIHFNGNNFDIPYITAKLKEFSINFSFDRFIGIDIYKRISPYKTFLKLENCKQKTIERFLKLEREDKFTGGDLIGIYHSFVKEKSEEMKKFLLLHNYEDIKGMLEILPILSYADLFREKIVVTKVSANYYNDENNLNKTELLMILKLPSPLPVPIAFLYDKCYFTGAGDQGMIRVPLYEEEMKYFYANHSDYYYLPNEDVALHKSVASFVDKAYREQAKASNCYTRKVSRYLPEWDTAFTPFFKRSYEDRELFFELTDERTTDRALFSEYASHVLNHMSIN